MKASRIHFQWSPEFSAERFKTGVSLHSHTLHSKESLDFIYKASRHSAPLRHVIRRGEIKYHSFYGKNLDLRRGWWTPPLAPLDAYKLEAKQVSDMGLTPLVSLTDHDDIEAPMSLQAINSTRKVPISVEWTVPFRKTFLHMGIHNLPPVNARALMDAMREHTANPTDNALKDMLAGFHALPGTLVVFNHPMWDEEGVGTDNHRKAVFDLLSLSGDYIHALELNGLRPWKENLHAILLAQTWSKPVVSGGDRHIMEPNALLNLTNTADFSEFASEVRSGHSEVLIASHYRESHGIRIFHNLLDTLKTYEHHGLGWREWPDRVFYTLDDGVPRSLSQLWERIPFAVAAFTNLASFASQAPVRQVLRMANPWTEPILP